MSFNFNTVHNKLLFVPLGGSNEIGMNLNLFHYRGEWIMVDMGVGFADDYLPGVDLITPNIDFALKIKDKIKALVLTHAHEDHGGALPYLWNELRCPIYATPFTAAVIRRKFAENGMEKQAVMHEVPLDMKKTIGEFHIEMVQLTHSIPEMQGLAIRTDAGTIFHTGDWKFDRNPVVGPVSNEGRLRELGDSGVLALICDSTNVFEEGESGSESEVAANLIDVIAKCKQLAVVTTFASNIGRLEAIAKAAEANGRAVVLAGRSLHRISEAAMEVGYLKDIRPFIHEKEARMLPPEKLLVICTGCQGESRAALSKMATNEHPAFRLRSGDTVIFSSRKIPGNEQKIGRIKNKLARAGVEIVTDRDAMIHVSGHPCRDELKHMYDLVRPKIAVPVHGEARHIRHHARLAKELGVAEIVEPENGVVIDLTPGESRIIGHVESGYLAVDGLCLLPADGNILRMRRKIRDDGCVFVTLVMDEESQLVAEPRVTAPGALDADEDADILFELAEAIEQEISQKMSDGGQSKRGKKGRPGGGKLHEKDIKETARTAVRRLFNNEFGKKPVIDVHLVRIRA